MGWYGRNRWKLDERKLMKLSEGLFAPKLGLKWEWKGTQFNLLQNGELLWCSLAEWTPPWEYPSGKVIAQLLTDYINTPVAKLRKGDLSDIKIPGWSGEPAISQNYRNLLRLLLVADRRIGKNTLSVWLFTEPDVRYRNIIGARL
jgi:hypothetical protein